MSPFLLWKRIDWETHKRLWRDVTLMSSNGHDSQPPRHSSKLTLSISISNGSAWKYISACARQWTLGFEIWRSLSFPTDIPIKDALGRIYGWKMILRIFPTRQEGDMRSAFGALNDLLLWQSSIKGTGGVVSPVTLDVHTKGQTVLFIKVSLRKKPGQLHGWCTDECIVMDRVEIMAHNFCYTEIRTKTTHTHPCLWPGEQCPWLFLTM